MSLTLPIDSNDRKNYALFSGCLRYFPAALAGIAKTSKLGNDKHNPGQALHHARNKSQDHGDCIMRHLVDVNDLLAAKGRGEDIKDEEILNEVSSMAWRALAFSQELHEKMGAPLAPGARVDEKTQSKALDGTALYEAGEKAQKMVAEMVKSNKENIFNVNKPTFVNGDIVKHKNNDAEVTVEGIYYDEHGKSVLFVRDAANQVFAVDPNAYKSIYVERKS